MKPDYDRAIRAREVEFDLGRLLPGSLPFRKAILKNMKTFWQGHITYRNSSRN